MHLTESHFKLLVWEGVCAGTAADTDKWWRQRALLELGDTYQQGRPGNLFGSRNTYNLFVVDEHQGYVAPRH